MNPTYGRDPLVGADRPAATALPASRMAAPATASNITSNASHTASRMAQSATTNRNDGQYPPYPVDSAAAVDVKDEREDCESLTPSTESWVEIESQPSSSSVSSIADEIVVTGLRIGHGTNGRRGATVPAMPQRRRRLLQQVEAEAVAAATAVTVAQPSASVTNSAAASASAPPSAAAQVTRSSAESSQEEYDETESEEDRMMTSSTEHVHVRHPPTPPQPFALLQQQAQARMQQRAAASDGDDEDDDVDDDGTALGTPTAGPTTFRPKPNAFSHPPHLLQQQQQQQQQHLSVPPPSHQHMSASYTRSSSLSQRASSRTSRASRGPPHFSSPTYPSNREDNDAALRASLTTLLSCAAAARGLPKKETAAYGESSAISPGLRPSTRPMDLCLVPESELMEETPAGVSHSRVAFQSPRMQSQTETAEARRNNGGGSSRPNNPPRSNPRVVSSSRGSTVSAVSSSSRSKRTAAAAMAAAAAGGGAAGSSKSQRATKKKRTSSAAYGEVTTTSLTPTMLTWVVSAGVVVLVSVVGFGAGFVLGREVGKQEAVSAGGAFGGSAASNATSSCGNEIMRSSTGSTLRRFRWGSGMTRSVSA